MENLEVAVLRKDGSRFVFDPAPAISHREQPVHRLSQNLAAEIAGADFRLIGDRRRTLLRNSLPILPDHFWLDAFFLGAGEGTVVVFYYDSADHTSYRLAGISQAGAISWTLDSADFRNAFTDFAACGPVLVVTGIGRAAGIDYRSGKVLWERGI